MKVVVFIVYIVVSFLRGNGQECADQIVCQRLRQVADDACAAYDVDEVDLGRKGEKGDRGDTAVVDYERIMRNIVEMRSQEIDALVIKVNERKETIEDLNQSLASLVEHTEREINSLMIKDNESMAMIEKLNESFALLKEECNAEKISATIIKENATIDKLNESIATDENNKREQEFCEVYYKGKCFWFVTKLYISLQRGEAICSKTPGGHLAVLYDEEHYKLILNYMKSLLVYPYVHSYARLGLKYNPANGQMVTIRGETKAPFVKWRPGNPVWTTTFTSVALQVNELRYEDDDGMKNQHPDSTVQGVLCEA